MSQYWLQGFTFYLDAEEGNTVLATPVATLLCVILLFVAFGFPSYAWLLFCIFICSSHMYKKTFYNLIGCLFVN